MSQQQTGPNAEHYEQVIQRLSAQIGALTVEKQSLSVLLLEKERELIQERDEVKRLKEQVKRSNPAKKEQEPEPVT